MLNPVGPSTSLRAKGVGSAQHLHRTSAWRGRAAATRNVEQRCQATLGDLSGDDDPLDFRRAFPDAVHADVAIQPLNGIVSHVASATEDLDTDRKSTRLNSS